MPRIKHAAPLLVGAAAFALAGCETLADVANDTAYEAHMIGGAEVPGPGDPDGTGNAEFTFDWVTGQVCYELHVRNIAQPTAAHIHRGGPGVAGPPVITLEAPDSGNGGSSECQAVPDAVKSEIQGSPSNFYVNVHTAEFPNGAIRAQLQP